MTMTDVTAPTAAQLDADDEAHYAPGTEDPLFEQVDDKIVGKSRWGYDKHTTFRRISDGTFWRALYRVTSGDEGDCTLTGVVRVYAREKTVTIYTTEAA